MRVLALIMLFRAARAATTMNTKSCIQPASSAPEDNIRGSKCEFSMPISVVEGPIGPDWPLGPSNDWLYSFSFFSSGLAIESLIAVSAIMFFIR